ncbi:MAG TPA: hypothetical protein VGD54_05700 [Steroidobacteraceae bacterium]
MTDVYVYRFTGWVGQPNENVPSKRLATLETIKQMGDPIMESQIVVDDAELDAHGFFRGRVANDSHPIEDVSKQIRSLTRRAESRDAEALMINEGAGGAHKCMLQLESRELRKQAQKLQKQHELAAAESASHAETPNFATFDGSATAG